MADLDQRGGHRFDEAGGAAHVAPRLLHDGPGDLRNHLSIDAPSIAGPARRLGPRQGLDNIDSDPNNITAFWLINLGNTVTNTLTLTNGQGSSNAQIFATGGQAVPEPATWGMMLLGFAGIGMAMRRSRCRNGALMQVA